MSQNRFQAFSGQLKQKPVEKEEVVVEREVVQSKVVANPPKEGDRRVKNPEDKVKAKTISIVPRVEAKLTEVRLQQAPYLSDSQFIQNLIWEAAYGEPFFDVKTGKILPNR